MRSLSIISATLLLSHGSTLLLLLVDSLSNSYPLYILCLAALFGVLAVGVGRLLIQSASLPNYRDDRSKQQWLEKTAAKLLLIHGGAILIYLIHSLAGVLSSESSLGLLAVLTMLTLGIPAVVIGWLQLQATKHDRSSSHWSDKLVAPLLIGYGSLIIMLLVLYTTNPAAGIANYTFQILLTTSLSLPPIAIGSGLFLLSPPIYNIKN